MMESIMHNVTDYVEERTMQSVSLVSNIQNVTIIGTGNVATWFVFALNKANIHISQIYGRDIRKCQILADTCGADPISNLSNLKKNSDLYIFSLKDDSYKIVVSQIPFDLPLAVLTAGSVSQNVLSSITSRYGILYPCQTFSQDMDYAHLQVPFCVEGCDESVENQLLNFASCLSKQVVLMHEKERVILHLSAVFACNFSNALYGIAFDFLKNANIQPDILIPLLQNTLKKLETMSPQEAQTGPAVRNDKSVINKHISMISDENLRRIYEVMTEEIIAQTVKKS